MITLITRDLSRKKSKLILLSNFRHILLAISLTLTSPHSWKRFREVVLDVDVVQASSLLSPPPLKMSTYISKLGF